MADHKAGDWMKKQPVLYESPHGWKDLVIWRIIPRRKFLVGSGVVMACLLYREWRLLGRTPGHAVYNKRMEDKTVVVTGGTSGVGEAAARVMAQRGARLILACRDVEKCGEVRRRLIHEGGNRNISCRYLDLASMASIRRFVAKVSEETPGINVLVNCAGLQLNPKGRHHERQLTREGLEMHMGVNHFGPFLLTNLLSDRLITNAPAHVINVCCHLHTKGELDLDDMNHEHKYEPRQAYYDSKLAGVLFSRELSRRLSDKNVKVITLGLPEINSAIHRDFPYYQRRVWRWLALPYKVLVFLQPRQAALILLGAVLGHFDDEHGEYTSMHRRPELGEKMADDLTAMKLWKLSELWTRIEPDTISDPDEGRREEILSSGTVVKPSKTGKKAEEVAAGKKGEKSTKKLLKDSLPEVISREKVPVANVATV